MIHVQTTRIYNGISSEILSVSLRSQIQLNLVNVCHFCLDGIGDKWPPLLRSARQLDSISRSPIQSVYSEAHPAHRCSDFSANTSTRDKILKGKRLNLNVWLVFDLLDGL